MRLAGMTSARSIAMAGTIGAATTALLMGSLATASASTPDTARAAANHSTDPGVTHPNLDHMGSGMRTHMKQVEAAATAGPAAMTPMVTQTPGLDVSGYQGNVNWSSVRSNGGRFAYVKATEGTGYTNPYFAQQYNGSYNAGLIRGAYHFALPNKSSGATQANYFVAHGGGWSKDGKTLPGALDIEWNPYGSACYGLSASSMVGWIKSFSDQYHAKTGRWPVIYTATSWWSQCTGNRGDFSSTNPLWVARYSSSVGTLPYHWGVHTIWQFADSGTFPGDQDRFNGDFSRVQALANG